MTPFRTYCDFNFSTGFETCHEVISARHMDYIFLQFNAEMNQIVYSGRSRARVAWNGDNVLIYVYGT